MLKRAALPTELDKQKKLARFSLYGLGVQWISWIITPVEDDLKNACQLLVRGWVGQNKLCQQKNRKGYYVVAWAYNIYVHAGHLRMWMLRMKYARPVNRLYREKNQLRQVMLVMPVAVGLMETMVIQGCQNLAVVVLLF